jgi:hypothetical protein
MRQIDYSKLLFVTAAVTSLAASAQTRPGTTPDEAASDEMGVDEYETERGVNRIDGGLDVEVDRETEGDAAGAGGATVEREIEVETERDVGAAGERDASGTAGALAGTRTGVAADPDRFIAELKPFPTLLSVIPGMGAAGIGLEGMMTPQISTYLDGYIIDSNLPERLEAEGRDRTEDDVFPEKFTGRSADLGARFYGEPYDSTWYTGVKVGFASMNGEFTYKNRERMDASYSAFTPGLTAGYRWLLGNNDDVLIRLGAVAAANVVQNIDTDLRNLEGTPDEEDARDKIDDRVKVPFLANVDFGLGYQF